MAHCVHVQFAVICYKWMQYADKNIQNNEKYENQEFLLVLKTRF